MLSPLKSRFPLYLLALLLSVLPGSKLLSQKPGTSPLDKLLEQYKNTRVKDTAFLSLLADISFEYYQIDPLTGIKFGNEGLALAKKLKSRKHLAEINNALAVNYWSQSKYNDALDYFAQALKLNEEIKDQQGISRILGNIGMVYFNLSDYPKALEYYFKAVKINEEMGNKKSMANKYSNIGLVYEKQKNFLKAIEYYNKSLKINQEQGNKNGIAVNLGNLGNTYSSLKQYDKSAEYHKNALKLDIELGNKRGMASDYGNLGETYTDMGKYDQAIMHQIKALEIRKQINNIRGIMFSYGGLAEIYLKISDSLSMLRNQEAKRKACLKLSMDYCDKAISAGRGIKAVKETADWYRIMAQVQGDLNNWKAAYLYTDSFNVLKDSVFNEETRMKLENIQAKWEMELKQNELELLKTKAERRKTAILAISSGILLTLVIVILIYRNLHHKSKITKLLREKYQFSVIQKDGLEIANNLIQKEVKKASRYLTSLLPVKLHQGPFRTDYLFVPSKQLGGDCFGYHWIDKECFAIFIVDVFGQGISSALHSVSVLNLLRTGKHINADPRLTDQFVAALNESFLMEDHGDLFFSIWYGVINTGNIEYSGTEDGTMADQHGNDCYRLSYTCAGHPPPLLFQPDGSIKEMGPPALAVGCKKGVKYQSNMEKIFKGSKLLLFSDGTYEITRKDGSVMNHDEFRKALIEKYHNRQFTLQEIYDSLEQQKEKKENEDDFSLLLIECSMDNK